MFVLIKSKTIKKKISDNIFHIYAYIFVYIIYLAFKTFSVQKIISKYKLVIKKCSLNYKLNITHFHSHALIFMAPRTSNFADYF